MVDPTLPKVESGERQSRSEQKQLLPSRLDKESPPGMCATRLEFKEDNPNDKPLHVQRHRL